MMGPQMDYLKHLAQEAALRGSHQAGCTRRAHAGLPRLEHQ